MSTHTLPKINTHFQPILLKGHEGPITQVKFNLDGDLLFSTATKDINPTVWYADSGERIGTYGGHHGAVWDIDPSEDSRYVVTACADGSARLFETITGRSLVRMPHKGVVRSVKWAEGSTMFATTSDPFTSRDFGMISVFDFPSPEILNEAAAPGDAPLHAPTFEIPVDGINKPLCLVWGLGNKCLIVGFENGLIVMYDVATQAEVMRRTDIHVDRVNKLNFNADKSLLITASKDTTAKLLDPTSLDVLKVYLTDTPVNAAVISPTLPHVLVGGGQDKGSVTVTSARTGKFETRFFHTIYEEEFGRVKGHFGPINALAMHPHGKSFASGSEDGFIRLHHFDTSYLKADDCIPEDVARN